MLPERWIHCASVNFHSPDHCYCALEKLLMCGLCLSSTNCLSKFRADCSVCTSILYPRVVSQVDFQYWRCLLCVRSRADEILHSEMVLFVSVCHELHSLICLFWLIRDSFLDTFSIHTVIYYLKCTVCSSSLCSGSTNYWHSDYGWSESQTPVPWPVGPVRIARTASGWLRIHL